MTLSIHEFERYLKIGLGRVIVYLKDHDASPYRDAILHACLHNTTYDTQVEGYKTDYMMEVIQLTGELDFYRERIFEATRKINKDSDDRDAGHVLCLTTEFAKQGDSEARQIIYDVFDRMFTDEDSYGVSSIIEIDKVDGFVYIIDKLAPISEHKRDDYWYEFLISELEDVIGKSEAHEALVAIRKSNSNIDAYLKQLEKPDANQRQAHRPRKIPQNPPYAEIKDKIGKAYVNPLQWGENASPDDLLLAAQDLILLDDPNMIWQYLKFFVRSQFPLDPQLLFRFVDVHHPNFPLPANVIRVLSKIQHPSVREFAFKLLDEQIYAQDAIELFALNYETSDWQIIEAMSKQTIDDWDYHSLQISVQTVFKHHPDPIAIQSLINIYEYGSCSLCRKATLEMLKSLDAIPAYIREECLYDSSPSIRELAGNKFVVKSDTD